MKGLYYGLDWSELREELRLLTGVQVTETEKPISDEELLIYLLAGDQTGSLQRFREGDNRTPIQIMQELNPNPKGRYSASFIRERLRQAGVRFPLEIVELEPRASYRDIVLRGSVYKLGSMLAVTDQLLYDAHASSLPLRASYLPSDPEGKRQGKWLSLFGESEVPTIEGLYKQAMNALADNVDRNDPFVAHLFEMDSTQYLKR